MCKLQFKNIIIISTLAAHPTSGAAIDWCATAGNRPGSLFSDPIRAPPERRRIGSEWRRSDWSRSSSLGTTVANAALRCHDARLDSHFERVADHRLGLVPLEGASLPCGTGDTGSSGRSRKGYTMCWFMLVKMSRFTIPPLRDHRRSIC